MDEELDRGKTPAMLLSDLVNKVSIKSVEWPVRDMYLACFNIFLSNYKFILVVALLQELSVLFLQIIVLCCVFGLVIQCCFQILHHKSLRIYQKDIKNFGQY